MVYAYFGAEFTFAHDLFALDLNVAMDHINAYFDRFGTKPCCFEDLQPYVDTFISSAEDGTKFIHSIRDATRFDSEEVSQLSMVCQTLSIMVS